MWKCVAFAEQILYTQIGDVFAIFHFQMSQMDAMFGNDVQAFIGNTSRVIEANFLHVVARHVSWQMSHKCVQRLIGVGGVFHLVQIDASPQIGLPGQKVEPSAHSGTQTQTIFG